MSDFSDSMSIFQTIAWTSLALAIVGGAIRVGTPYLFVSLGECITERAGRVNLGLEGTLVMGAMVAYTVSHDSNLMLINLAQSMSMDPEYFVVFAPWLGVLAAALVGALMGVMHALGCSLPRVNSVAFGIAMMVFFANGLAKDLGKRMIQPVAPKLPAVSFGWWAETEQMQFALRVNAIFLIGMVLTPILAWMLTSTRWGMVLRLAGESEEAAAAMGYSVNRIRTVATALGGFLAGIGGSFLSLYYPGSWTETISSGQGLMAVALVIFARWSPLNCFWASLLFGGAGALGPALQGQGLVSGAAANLWYTAPYVLTLVIMLITSSRDRAMAGAPGVLTQAR